MMITMRTKTKSKLRREDIGEHQILFSTFEKLCISGAREQLIALITMRFVRVETGGDILELNCSLQWPITNYLPPPPTIPTSIPTVNHTNAFG